MSEKQNSKGSQHHSMDSHGTSPLILVFVIIALGLVACFVFFKDRITEFFKKSKSNESENQEEPVIDMVANLDEVHEKLDELKESQEETPIKIPEEIPEKVKRASNEQ
jgi:flagellar basal body-associated protein FliL